MAIVFNSANTQSVRENLDANSAIYTAAAVFDAGESGTITYSLGGTDASLLTIDENTGQIFVLASTDFENKSSYSFSVIATSGETTATLDVVTSVINTIEGTTAADELSGTTDDDVLAGGLGDDTVDGGTGYNIYEVEGSADTFIWSVNSAGQLILQDLFTEGDGYNASNQGTDTLSNIQVIRYIREDGSIEYDLEVDDHSNNPSDTNTVINFGERVTGRFDFYGDEDYFKLLDTFDGKVHLSSDSSKSFYIQSGSTSNSLAQYTENRFFNNILLDDLYVRTNQISSDSAMSSKSYDFTLRRVLEGTDDAETLTAGSNFEYVDGGLGDDVIIGSNRSDYLLGGDGDDIITGGKGNDLIDNGGGANNIVVFSGNFAEYQFSWHQDYIAGNYVTYLQVSDSVSDRDGNDKIVGAQILRFADGDVIIDGESNASVQIGDDVISIGQSVSGSLPITASNFYNDIDTDYFKVNIPLDISSETNLRIPIKYLGD